MNFKQYPFDLSANPQEAFESWNYFLTLFTTKQQEELESFEPLKRIFGNSSFLTRFLTRHPHLALELKKSPFLNKVKSIEEFKEEIAQIQISDFSEWIRAIKIFKYKELLRITIKDLSDEDQVHILKELSFLAIAILQAVDHRVYQKTTLTWGRPLDPHGNEVRYHILLLGKLGGHEINYSSDIDMIAFNESDQGQSEKGLSIHEFFVRHIQALSKAMQERDYEGFLYRVDWELRPEGKAGTLVNSLSALETYYTSFGADWERQMLTKANLGAGDMGLGKEFISMIRPFVYQKFLDIKAIERILEMKQKVHEELLKKPSKGFHVKLGIGGIREIEFYVQALLLVYAGKQKVLRGTSTLEVLDKLQTAKLIGHQDARSLKSAYLFLRKLEHRLQIVEESQTHTLPESDEEQTKAARRMNYFHRDPKDALQHFQNDLAQHRKTVYSLFQALFSEHHLINPNLPIKEGDRPYLDLLRKKFTSLDHLEEKIDALRLFKNEEIELIQELEASNINKRSSILEKISKLASSICVLSLELAIDELKARFGIPIIKGMDHKTGEESHILGIGMGKLGGNEINYGSDLDMIFIYSENGETNGERIISNREYFAKLVQKFIFILNVHTRYGRSYEIDTELRPSGHSGPLVTSLERFIQYQRKEAMTWERQSLLRARPIIGHSYLAQLFKHQLDSILFSKAYPDQIRTEMDHLRMRVENELANENSERFDFKKGKGGIMDIEFIVQFIQLRLGHEFENLRIQNTTDLLDQIILLHPFKENLDFGTLKIAYNFYRTLESKLFLFKGRKQTQVAYDEKEFDELADSMKYLSWNQVAEDYRRFSQNVRALYLKIFEEGLLKA